MPRGMRKLPERKGPKLKPGADPEHLAAVRRMDCLLRGRRGTMLVWRGVHPRDHSTTGCPLPSQPSITI